MREVNCVENNLLIFGNNNLSRLMVKYITKYTDCNFLGFCVDREYMHGEEFEGNKNIAFEDIRETYPQKDLEILICIGNNRMNDIRKAVYERIKNEGYRIAQFIHPTVNLESSIIGEGNIILENANIGMDVNIGNCNVIWNGCNISHGTSIGSFNYIAPSVAVAGNVCINDNCFFGINSTLRSNISVASYTYIGAGCYLNNSTECNDVYVPAKAVKLERKSSEMTIN